MTSNIPNELKYTASHEWVRQDNEHTVTIGITDHAQELLGDIVYIELPEVKTQLQSGEGCAVIESVKAAADVYAPISGEAIEVNQALSVTPELVNQDPYGEGWLFRVTIKSSADLQDLFDAARYKDSIESK